MIETNAIASRQSLQAEFSMMASSTCQIFFLLIGLHTTSTSQPVDYMYHASIAIECVFKLWAPIRPLSPVIFRVCLCLYRFIRNEWCALFLVRARLSIKYQTAMPTESFRRSSECLSSYIIIVWRWNCPADDADGDDVDVRDGRLCWGLMLDRWSVCVCLA